MANPRKLTPSERCPSLKRAVLHAEGGREIYLRCAKGDGHESRFHKSWMVKWTDDREDGWIEDDYDDDDDPVDF